MQVLFTLALSALSVNAYWLMAIEDFITTERIDPVIGKNKVAVSSHTHSVFGGSNFRFNTTTAGLRESDCTSVPIPEDKSAYWLPQLYFQWNNGSFTSLTGGPVVYYLFSDTSGSTTAFPDDFRMISGDPTLRTYNSTSSAQKAITFLCLDFQGKSVVYNSLPPTTCASGIRSQINFPSCWDGKNLDSADHKSHVAFLSGGPDSGTCNDPNFPITLPRIFIEVYWNSNDFDSFRPQAMNSTQPFVFAHGDPVGYGYHADYVYGWDAGVLQNAVDKCNCNPFGDPTCCVNANIFSMTKNQQCHITKSIDEQTTGTLLRLPGNNPVQPEGKTATIFPDNVSPPLIAPVFAYNGSTPTATGHIVTPGQTSAAVAPVVSSSASKSSTSPKPSSSSNSVHVAAAAPSTTSSSTHVSVLPTILSVSSSVPGLPLSTSSHPNPSLPSPTSLAAAKSTSPSSSDFDTDDGCRAPNKRRSGLDYHRHHRRLSHHDFFHEAIN